MTVRADTAGHSRSRSSCKSGLQLVSVMPARARACSSWCTRLVPAWCCPFSKHPTEMAPIDHHHEPLVDQNGPVKADSFVGARSSDEDVLEPQQWLCPHAVPAQIEAGSGGSPAAARIAFTSWRIASTKPRLARAAPVRLAFAGYRIEVCESVRSYESRPRSSLPIRWAPTSRRRWSSTRRNWAPICRAPTSSSPTASSCLFPPVLHSAFLHPAVPPLAEPATGAQGDDAGARGRRPSRDRRRSERPLARTLGRPSLATRRSRGGGVSRRRLVRWPATERLDVIGTCRAASSSGRSLSVRKPTSAHRSGS
jgi:hypothetical protein